MYFTVSTSTQAIYISFTISDAIAGKFRNVDESRAWCRSILGAGKNLDKDTQRLEYRNFTSVGLAFDSPAYVLWAFLSVALATSATSDQASLSNSRPPSTYLDRNQRLVQYHLHIHIDQNFKVQSRPGFAFLQVQ
jgi:hypothetical protein